MIPVLSVQQMRSIDGESIRGDLAVGYSYMVRAGRGLFDTIAEMMRDRPARDIAVVCGKGNNGGDGYVAARLLLEAGYGVMCYSLCDASQLTGEARLAFDEYVGRNGNLLFLSDAGELAGLEKYALIVDAILGTGIKGSPRGLAADVIAAINASSVPVVGVDTPSGLDNDTGVPGDPCVKATVTVTMGFPKLGAYLYPGRSHVGRLVIRDLGYPEEIVRRHAGGLQVPSLGRIRSFLPPRKPAGSKFDHGLVLLVAGSRGMTGSAALAAEAGLRSGCGMVHLAAPSSAVAVLSAKLTETVIHALPETEQGSASSASIDPILDLAQRMQVVCIGPGLSHAPETSALVRRVVSTVRRPVVLDADGINAYRDCSDELRKRQCDLIMTPHRGEWARLFGRLPDDPRDVIEVIRRGAIDFTMTVLLKGNPTFLAQPSGAVFLLPFGNSGMATAGTGDVLSGIISALVAQGCTTADAGVLGAFLHGRAGEIASERCGEYSVIARDLISILHCAIGDLLASV